MTQAPHGVTKVKLQFKHEFNTVVWNKLSGTAKQRLGLIPLDVPGASLKYRRLPPYPKVFDPRSPKTIPQGEYSNWFITDLHGHPTSVISFPLDQGKCGSCWGFALASMWTDTLRHSIINTFKESACIYSKIFAPLSTCTGSTGVEQVGQGVVSTTIQGKSCDKNSDCDSDTCLPNKTCLELIGVEVRDRISAYFMIGFAPKLKSVCRPDETLEQCSLDCTLLYKDWKDALDPKKSLSHNIKELGQKAGSCSGCEGNAIIMPLFMAVTNGAPLASEFPIQEWGCIFGTNEMRKVFCTEEFITDSVATKKFPALIKADRYGHYVADDLKDNRPIGINTMEEWIMAEVYNNSSVSVGYIVYPSFYEFFDKNPRGIYTFKRFSSDIRKGSQQAAGGHAVDIIGWGEEEVDGELVKYWVIRNSWSEQWGDNGFFKFERGMDEKLTAAGLQQYLTHIEGEFGTLYYAPYPNKDIYSEDVYTTIKVNNKDVKISKNLLSVIQLPPRDKCEGIREDEKKVQKQIVNCRCPSGYVLNTSGICVKDISGTYNRDQKIRTYEIEEAEDIPQKIKWPWFLLFLSIFLLFLIWVVYRA